MTRVNPYNALKERMREEWTKVEYPHRIQMWLYPKERLGEGWSLVDLAERVAAAKQLGYEAVLENRDGNLHVIYQKERPKRPFELTY